MQRPAELRSAIGPALCRACIGAGNDTANGGCACGDWVVSWRVTNVRRSSCASDSWVTAGDPRSVRAVLKAGLRGRRPRLLSTDLDGPVEAALGSRFVYRMLGFLTPTELIPMRLTARVTAMGAGSRVDLEAVSEEGRYLFRVDSWADAVHSRGAVSLFSSLRGVAPPAG